MAKLRVRVYGVRFGDAILVSVPESTSAGKTKTRHLLIDVGNAARTEGGADTVFKPVVEDILKVTGNKPVDLYVMTHEHMDHVQGLLYASQKLGLPLKANYAWLTASAAEDYYDTHPTAKEKRLQAMQVRDSAARFLLAAPEAMTPMLAVLMANNDSQTTECCVDHLRHLTDNPDHTTYVFRGCKLTGTHPFKEAKFSIWAPEEDTTAYYGRFQPLALGVGEGPAPGAPEAAAVPPAGVDAGTFYDLVESRRRGHLDNLMAIDQAANNTSVVFCLEWRGWKLLFTGDAEHKSWKMMDSKGVLKPVHFLKVSHHGSETGTPDESLLEKILPSHRPDQRKRRAVVSTYPGTYSRVPDETLVNREVGGRCDALCWVNKGTVADGGHVDFDFQG